MQVKGHGRTSFGRVLLVTVGFALGLAGLAAAQLQTAPVNAPPSYQEFVPGEILVKFHSYVPASTIDAIHRAFGNEAIYQSPRGGFQRVRIAAGQSELAMIDAYQAIPLVEYAQLNSICHATAVPNDTYYSYQWHFPLINMPSAWDTATGSGVVAAILDTGIAYEDYPVPSWESSTVASGVTTYLQAPDLAGTGFVAGYDYINNDSHPNDNNSHGTHVAGTVAQTTNNAYGVAGIAYNAALMPIKVLDYTGSGTAQTLADGLYWAADHGANVANMSLSWSPGYDPGPTVHNAIQYAYNAGVTLCGAAGNSGTSTVSYPAAYAEVIAVGSVRYDKRRASYSQYGSALEVVAPGGDTSVDQNGDGWVQLTYDDFEGGWGNFTDGGGDCRLYKRGKHAHQGRKAADIQDNSGVASSFYLTNGIDVASPGYTQIKVEFWFKAVSMDNSNEDFWVQYFDGSTWHTVADYNAGIEFQNGTFYSATVTIDEVKISAQ